MIIIFEPLMESIKLGAAEIDRILYSEDGNDDIILRKLTYIIIMDNQYVPFMQYVMRGK